MSEPDKYDTYHSHFVLKKVKRKGHDCNGNSQKQIRRERRQKGGRK